MVELTRTAQVEGILRKEFPGGWAPPPITPLGQPRSKAGAPEKSADHAEMLERLAARRAQLEALPQQVIDELYRKHQEASQALEALRRAQAEKERPFNQPGANADFTYWAKAESWSLDESVALLLGKAPEVVTWESVRKLVGVSEFAKRYERLRNLGLRASAMNHGSAPVRPHAVLEWARRVDCGVSAELEALLTPKPSAPIPLPLVGAADAEPVHELLVPLGKKLFDLADVPKLTARAAYEGAWDAYDDSVPEEKLLMAVAVQGHRDLLKEAVGRGEIVPWSRMTGMPAPREWQDDNRHGLALPFAELKRFCRALLIDVVPVEDAPVSPGLPSAMPGKVVHRLSPKTHALAAVIEQARERAADASDYQSVWAALVRIAQSSDRPAPIIGYVDAEGVQYQSAEREEPKYFTKKALKERFSRARAR